MFALQCAVGASLPFADALKESDLDLNACRILQGSGPEPLDAGVVASLLGLGNEKPEASVRGKARPEGMEAVQYLLVFKQPVLVGTVVGGTGELRVLKPGSPLPPTPSEDSQWLVINVAPNQSEPRFAPLPPATSTSAMIVSVMPTRAGSCLRLVSARLTNHTPAAAANGQSEFTTEPYLSAPYTYDAGHITRGRGEWISSGKNGKGINPRAEITDVAPAWFILSWPQKRDIQAVLLQDNFEVFALQVYDGPDGINAVAGTEQEWKTLRKFKQIKAGGLRWLSFDGQQTRALRLLITKTGDGPVAKLGGFHVLAELVDKPVPVWAGAAPEQPPVRIRYELAQAGKVTVAVDGPDGSRVRNLVANVTQAAGVNSLAWDLKDENGAYVPAGKYRWKAITHPGLELRYEMTAYPNVTSYFPERPAWLNGHNGAGGWLADHTAPHTVCVAGDRVFVGAPVAESGVSLLECDLDGRKVWGEGSFGAFTGCWMLASDGKTLFNTMAASNFAKAGLDKSTEGVWAVDLQTRKLRTVTMLQPSADRKRGVQGFAARDNKIYLAIHAPDDWLNSAGTSADVDPLNCQPAYATPRASRGNGHEVVADPRNDFLRLFRLKDTPPGQGLGLTYLESTKSADREQNIVLAFAKPVPVGCLVFPLPPKEEKVQFQVSVLKADAPYPPRLQEKGDWQVVPVSDKSAWAVLPLPAGTATRAVRFSFIRGSKGAADDLLADIEEGTGGPSLDRIDPAGSRKSGLANPDSGSWMRQLEGVKLLTRRFENLFSTATVRVSSGKVSPCGSWDAQRSEPLSEADPAIYALEWKQAQPLRGLAIREIDGAQTEIDVFTGPAGSAVDIKGADGWEKIATYKQALRHYYQPDALHNSQARYLDGYVDFGREVNTRAVRLRIVKQWDSKGHRPSGVRSDQGGQTLDLKRCRVYGIAPVKYLGGEKPGDPMVAERIEVLDATSAKIVQEVHLANVGTPAGGASRGNVLAFNPDGELFAIADEKLVRVDLVAGKHQPLVTDLITPTALACDSLGNFFISDSGAGRKNIRVYNPAGKLLRVIGAAGGYQRGVWDPNRLGNITGLAVDGRGQVWATEYNTWPKRVSLWSNEGKFLKEFLGPTEYGGGGGLDPGDKRRLFYGPLEFDLDWATGKTRLKNLTSLAGDDAGDMPMRVNNRLYLVNVRPNSFGTSCGLVYLHEGDHCRLVAAVGLAGKCKQLLDPKLVKAFGGKVMLDYVCAWSDLNGDEQAQAEEVQLWPKPKENLSVMFDSGLGAQIGRIGFRVKEWLANGAPVYERFEAPALWTGMTLRLDNGNFYHFENNEHSMDCAALKADGTPVWTYRTEGAGVHALTKSKPLYPGQIVCGIGIAGHATAHAGDLGEFVVSNTNTGVFNIMTVDGLFAGQIFRDLRDRSSRPWSTPETSRGHSLEGFTIGQEHFAGYFCRTNENQYFAVAGHNHASVVEVLGMDRFKRFGGELNITPVELSATQNWDRERAVLQVYSKAPVVDCYRMAVSPKLDGVLSEWPTASARIDSNAKFYIGYDNSNLYLAYEIDRRGPLKNQGQQWDRLFKSGASVDFQIASDPAAPVDRHGPVAGDQRLLMTFMGSEPAAVLYQAVVPATPASEAWQVVSPVAAASFDSVKRLEKPRLVTSGNDDHYVLEASIPLETLGLKITPGLRLKMDWGVLTSGPDGTEVLQREYWANKSTQITSDAPSEALLHPDLWGHIRFHAETAGAGLDPTSAKPDKALDDVLNDLK